MGDSKKPLSPLRQKVLFCVSALAVLSLVGSGVSLYRITEVNRSLNAFNQVSIPLERLLTKMRSDGEILRREMYRRLGYTHWKNPHWSPQPIPKWIGEVLTDEIVRARELVSIEGVWVSEEDQAWWQRWVEDVADRLATINQDSTALYSLLENGDEKGAMKIYPGWVVRMDEWIRQLKWGVSQSERFLSGTLEEAESRISQSRAGLQILLIVVIFLSALLLWFGERALRPLGDLTRLAREIARRGLRKEDKSSVPRFSLGRTDEVSQLSREFHRMATTLLEREKTVDEQKRRLEQTNLSLSEMGALNESVLDSIDSILIVADLEGKITQINPKGLAWLKTERENVLETRIFDWKPLQAFIGAADWPEYIKGRRLSEREVEGRTLSARLMPLNGSAGAIICIDDLTEFMDLQQRLRTAENLAAIGRMSAQVAHEVRNPLHSIGLEAELALEEAEAPRLKQSLQSILSSVDRLESVTENYLKLSRPSEGTKDLVDVGEVLEAVLAQYAPICEQQKISVDWNRESQAKLLVKGDRSLLENALGNLLKNALQALEGKEGGRIEWSLGSNDGKVWLRIVDNGDGVPESVRDKIFTPFVTTRAQGTGLGLSFIKKVIEDMGGSIRSVYGGVGACFEVVLPQAHPSYQAEAPQAGVEL